MGCCPSLDLDLCFFSNCQHQTEYTLVVYQFPSLDINGQQRAIFMKMLKFLNMYLSLISKRKEEKNTSSGSIIIVLQTDLNNTSDSYPHDTESILIFAYIIKLT